MKNFKKVLALVLAVATLLSFATVAGAYTDVTPATDYAEAIEVLSAVGVLEGNTGYSGAFRPTDTITREEAAKLIAIFDNGSTNIADLYTTTNPFADVIGRWSASYVGYCFKAGIVVGPRANMFEPKENVTGTQFLKMALTVLGYDAEKEALVGPSWDVNTLKLARDAGLLEGLAANWKPEDDLKRGEAAEILYNAFSAATVEYGSAIRYFAEGVPEYQHGDNNALAPRLVTVAGAYPTGKDLCETWGFRKQLDSDAFWRPIIKWVKGDKTVCTVMQRPVAEYTDVVTCCDLLVKLGVPKTDTTTTKNIRVHINGGAYFDWTLKHTVEPGHCAMEALDLGGKGTLTQVFKGENGYIVTLIETWLGKITKAAGTVTSKDGHLKTDKAVELDIYTEAVGGNEYCTNCDIPATATYGDPTGLAKGNYVLVNYSLKTNKIEKLVKTEAVAGKLTGFVDWRADDPFNYTITRVSDADKPDSFQFHLGYINSKDSANVGKDKAFFYDFYGNVIGMVDPAAAAVDYKYVVFTRAWGTWADKGTAYANADAVALDASKSEVQVASLNNGKGLAGTAANWANWFETTSMWDFEDYRSFDTTAANWTLNLYRYSLNNKGQYVCDKDTVNSTYIAEASFVETGKPNVYNAAGAALVNTNEYTKYLFRNPDGSFVSFENYKNVKSATLSGFEYVMDANNQYAAVVYANVVAYGADSATAFVANPVRRDVIYIGTSMYERYTVYINGVETLVYARTGDVFNFGAGIYNLTFVEDENGVKCIKADLVTAVPDIANTYTVEYCTVTALKVAGIAEAKNITDVPVYVYDTVYMTLKAATTDDVAGKVYLQGGIDNIKAIYVIDSEF